MECADAGTLKEVINVRRGSIPEPEARYYLRQIGSAISYLHGKGIAHSDLHSGNVLLKYVPLPGPQDHLVSGQLTKKCLICDLGMAVIKAHEANGYNELWVDAILDDVSGVRYMLEHMVSGRMSPECAEVIKHEADQTIDQLMAMPWFQAPVRPPTVTAVLPHRLPRPVTPEIPRRRPPSTEEGIRQAEPEPHSRLEQVRRLDRAPTETRTPQPRR